MGITKWRLPHRVGKFLLKTVLISNDDTMMVVIEVKGEKNEITPHMDRLTADLELHLDNLLRDL